MTTNDNRESRSYEWSEYEYRKRLCDIEVLRYTCNTLPLPKGTRSPNDDESKELTIEGSRQLCIQMTWKVLKFRDFKVSTCFKVNTSMSRIKRGVSRVYLLNVRTCECTRRQHVSRGRRLGVSMKQIVASRLQGTKSTINEHEIQWSDRRCDLVLETRSDN